MSCNTNFLKKVISEGNFFVVAIIVVVVALIISHNGNKKEGWFYNDFRKCLLCNGQYPGWWVAQYGPDGERFPYAKANEFIKNQPDECGGCWGAAE